MPDFQFSGAKHPLPGRWETGFLDFWKTEIGDHIGVPLIGGRRPLPVGRGHIPISIGKASFDPVDCPVFGEQIGIITESLRPKPVSRGSYPILTGRATVAPVDWPLFGEQDACNAQLIIESAHRLEYLCRPYRLDKVLIAVFDCIYTYYHTHATSPWLIQVYSCRQY